MDVADIEKILRKNGVSEETAKNSVGLLAAYFGPGEIEGFCEIQKGMTNQLFYFQCQKKEYLIRIPGKGTEYLLDRRQEAWLYQTLEGKGITDRYIALNPDTGVKITEYIPQAHTCDIRNKAEVKACIRHLCHFHQMKLVGESSFDVFDRLEKYEKACQHDIAGYLADYPVTRQKIERLKDAVSQMPKEKILCHVDPVPDNFLIQSGKIYLIDWEYAAMSDPHMDIAMFCIYAGYCKSEIDEVIDFYFKEGCVEDVRKKIYGYVAACGLLWTVWCEIKRDAGILFEEYEKVQYQYAKDYCDLVI